MPTAIFLRTMSILLLVSRLIPPAQAEDWSQFRGSAGNALSSAPSVPVDFSEAAIVWTTSIVGSGWSSPVISNGSVWITTAEVTKATEEQIAKKTAGVQFAKIKTVAASVKLRALCIDASTGKIQHNLLLRTVDNPDLINPLNSYASPTAAISGDRVVCHFGSYGTWCLDKTTGKEIWNSSLVVDHSVGPGSSPIVADQIVLLVCDGIDQQFVAGLNLNTGKELWRTPRPKMRTDNGEFRKAYSTPLLIEIDGQMQAVVPGAQWMCAYAPASGREIWRVDCGSGFSTTPMAVYESGLVICSTGFMTPELVAVNPSGSGDITESNVVWRSKQGGSTMPTAVAKDGLLYSISDKGILTVLKATSGEIVNQKRIGGKFAASPLLVNDSLYLSSQEGLLTVLACNDLQQIARNQLNGTLMASPAVLDSDLIIRTGKSLLRVSAR